MTSASISARERQLIEFPPRSLAAPQFFAGCYRGRPGQETSSDLVVNPTLRAFFEDALPNCGMRFRSLGKG
jgi:hypothetical protein